MPSNLIIQTNATVSGTPATFVNATGNYQTGQVINQQLVLQASGSYVSPVGFQAFTMQTSSPVQLVCTKGGNANYINQVVNQTVTIDDTVDSFTLMNLGTVVATLNLTYSVNTTVTPVQPSFVTSVNDQKGAVQLLAGQGITIDNTTAPITISATATGLVKTVSGQSPNGAGNVTISTVDANQSFGESAIANTGATTGTTQLKRLASGNGVLVSTNTDGNVQFDVPIGQFVNTINGVGADNTGAVQITANGGVTIGFNGNGGLLISTTPGAFVKSIDNLVPDSTGNISLSSMALPGLRYEFGNLNQANTGRGIDKGTYYQADANVAGWTVYGGLTFTPQPDGTFILPTGIYLVTMGAVVATPAADTFALPAQVSVSINATTSFGFPGIYQQAVNYSPGPALVASQAVNAGSIGFISVSGSVGFDSVNPGYIGFSKVTGTGGQILVLQGYVTLVKIG